MSLTRKRKRPLQETQASLKLDEEKIADLSSDEENEEELSEDSRSSSDDTDSLVNFGELNLGGSDDDSISAGSDIELEEENGKLDEWEDIKSVKDDDVVSDDSDYIGSSHGDKDESIVEVGKSTKESDDDHLPKDISRSKTSPTSNRLKGISVKKLRGANALLSKSKPSLNAKKKAAAGKKTPKIKERRSKKKAEMESALKIDPAFDEYATSDEEDLRNTIGNVPINWYDEYDHIGYGLDGKRIGKPQKGDALDKLLDKLENPDHGRTVLDKQTLQDVKLSDDDLKLVQRLLSHRVPDENYDMYPKFQDLYSHEVEDMPLSGQASSKTSFLPSRHERKKVVRLALLIRRGLYKPQPEVPERYPMRRYDLWKPRSKYAHKLMKITKPIPPPPMHAPNHSLSYNPPPEFLIQRVDRLMMEGKIPKTDQFLKKFWRKFTSIREIPLYRETMADRRRRLDDLYMGSRKACKRMVGKSKDLLPKIPDKKDLRPYPTVEEIVFRGHRSIIRTISVHSAGKYLASGSDDHTVKVWEVSTGRCLRTFEVEEAVKKVSWNPNPKLFMLAICMGNMVVFLCPETYLTDKVVVQQTNSIFKVPVDQGYYQVPRRVEGAVTWRKATEHEWDKGYRVVLDHFKEVKEVVWHNQGDYFASVIPEGQRRSVLVHQLSRWRSQLPFQANKGRVQTIAFHPKQPYFFLVTQTYIRMYNLKRQSLLKKIKSNSRWLSCIAIHPGGEHVVVGGYDRKVNWFELECTKRPHLMRYHGNAVRSIKFHRKYPLFASGSDDRKLFVLHATVFDDWIRDPKIVLLKQLRGHHVFDDYYVLDVDWHPFEPYLFSAGADATIRMWH